MARYVMYHGGQPGQATTMRLFGYRFVLGQATKVRDADVARFTVERRCRNADGTPIHDPGQVPLFDPKGNPVLNPTTGEQRMVAGRVPRIESVFVPGYELLPEDYVPEAVAVQHPAPSQTSEEAVETAELRARGRRRPVLPQVPDEPAEEVIHG